MSEIDDVKRSRLNKNIKQYQQYQESLDEAEKKESETKGKMAGGKKVKKIESESSGVANIFNKSLKKPLP